MRKLLLGILCLGSCLVYQSASAQLMDRIKNKVKQRVDQRVDQGIDKGMDKVEDGAKTKTKTEDGETKVKTENGETKTKTESKGLKSYSRYDFIPGDKILYTEDFAQEVIGEYPAKWTTNGSGEIVTVEGKQGKWLQMQENTLYTSSFKKSLPENYTVEFDVLCEYKDDQAVPDIQTYLRMDPLPGHAYGGKLEFTLAPNSGTSATRDGVFFNSFTKEGSEQLTATKKLHSAFNDANHKLMPVHVAIWVQKSRFRAWLNQEKMYDLPQGADAKVFPNKLEFQVSSYGGPRDAFQYYISNLKIAVASPDTRNKLITEGKWSTSGILFDVNADKIQPQSYGVLKDIAAVLKENEDVKVKIIGYTDSDGDDAKNLDLSKRRAAAVKAALTKEFDIDASRMETDGLGETKPVADNKTPEGKAQNRRVEFIKM